MNALSRFQARLRPSAQCHSGYPIRVAWEEAIQDPASGILGTEVAEALSASKAPASAPFNGLCFALYQSTGDSKWRDVFVEEALRPLAPDFPRSVEGAWTHPRGRQLGGRGVLIDSFQEEASRVIKLAWLIRRGDASGADPEQLEAAAVEQFCIHRQILRDPDTGLWHNARDWVGPERLSPGFWSRGHGWLLRGLWQSIRYLPEGNQGELLKDLLRDLAGCLLKVRTNEGLWPAMLGEAEASPVEPSGSAMVAAVFQSAAREGVLEPRFGSVAEEAAKALLAGYLTEEGVVLGACPGPGPLRDPSPYYSPVNWPEDEPHGIAGFAALARAFSAR